MYRVDTHTGAPVVKENQQGYRTAIRETFPDPQNGFELISNFNRSANQRLLTMSERGLYLLLCDYVGKKMDGKYWCCPAVTTLADTLGASDRSIQLWLNSLIKKGFVTRETRIRNGSHTSNSYYLTPSTQVGVVNGASPEGVNGCAPGVVNSCSPKETSGNETRKEETTPQTPQEGASCARVRMEVKKAIREVCGDYKGLSDRTVSQACSVLIQHGYAATNVYALADHIRNDCWATYEGQLKPYHLERHCEDEAMYETH